MAIVASSQITIVDVNDGKSLQLYLTSTSPKVQIFNPNNGTYTPDWVAAKPVITPELFITGTSANIATQASFKWYEGETEILTTNTDYTITNTAGAKSLTINKNILSTKNAVTLKGEATWTDPDTGLAIIAVAQIDFSKVNSGSNGSNGQNAITALLTNENHTVATDSAGANGIFTNANTEMKVYNGATDDSANWTVVAGTPVGITGSLTGKVYTVTAMSADSGYVDLTASRSGYSSMVKRFSLNKSKTGVAGTSPTAYQMTISAAAIQKTEAGVLNPTSITASSFSQTGTAARVAYAARWIFQKQTVAGGAWTAIYTGATNEVSKAMAVPSDAIAVKVLMYVAGGTTTLLDEQIIPVVADGNRGNDGTNALLVTTLLPDGSIFKNGSGGNTGTDNIRISTNTYDGSTLVSSGVTYKWFFADPLVTTGANYDADAGAGWSKISATNNGGGAYTGYTTGTLVVAPSGVQGTESFRVVVIYDGRKATDTAGLSDVNDPHQLVIQGADKFKNGGGDPIDLTARVFLNGAEIADPVTAGYKFSWNLYNSAGVLANTTGWPKTARTITVTPSDITVRGTVICDVSK